MRNTRNSDLFSNNQSLILMEVRTEDSGKFTCIARDEFGHSISHTTRWIENNGINGKIIDNKTEVTSVKLVLFK